ncbi:MAG TPA: hypothetical protein ENK62_02100 [Chromatiales bacterium]|nr:hypothetical protein [Chromatiales bacterium]
METATIEDVVFDEYGFLANPGAWDRELAESIAGDLGIERLTEDHWRLIDYVREHWQRCRAIHPAQQICRHFGLDKKCVWRLFVGPLELWKVAGLPYPGTEAYTYMENEDPLSPPFPHALTGFTGSSPPGSPGHGRST